MLKRIASSIPRLTSIWCWAALLITGFLVGGATFSLVRRVLEQPSELQTVFRPTVQSVLLDTLVISVSTMLLTVSAGFILGTALRFSGVRAMWIILGISLFPLVTDQIIRNYAFYTLLGESGIWGSFSDLLNVSSPPQLLYTQPGVVLGISHGLIALATIPIWLSLQRVSNSAIQAARVHGARPIYIFRDLILPKSLPGVAAGAFFVFVLTLGYYVTPKMLGGRSGLTIAALIDQQINNLGNMAQGSVLSLLLITLCLPFIILTPHVLSLIE